MVIAVSTVCGCAQASPPGRYNYDGGSFDGAFDGAVGIAPLFAPCGHDRECEKRVGSVCLTTYPGGLCSFRCDSDGDCSSEHVSFFGRCVSNLCLPRCSSVESCTTYGGACVPSSGGFCTPACVATSRVKPGEPACVAGTTCDEYANACFPAPRTVGADNGEPCRDGADCRSEHCIVAADGYPEGYCYSYGLLPPKTEFVKGQPLPRSTCPAGSVVLPMHLGGGAPGQITPCFRGCTADTECRTGYTCKRLDTLGFTSGYCGPVDCSESPCPAGYRCELGDAGGGKCVK